MIKDDFLKKQIEQARESAKLLKTSQDLLDNSFDQVFKRLKKEDPEKAEKLNGLREKSKKIFKEAEKGDFGQINNLIKDLKDGFKNNK